MNQSPDDTLRDVSAEQSVLGTILLHGEIRGEETELLQPDHFSLKAHKEIFNAILKLAEDDAPIDPVAIASNMNGTLEAADGISYISELLDYSVDRKSLAYHIGILDEKLAGRRLMQTAEWILGQAQGRALNVEQVLSKAQDRLFKIAGDSAPESESLLAPWAKFKQHGVDEVDWLVDGVIEKGTNGFIVALPKGGKSVASLSLACALATGQRWLEFRTCRRRVAVVSREDYAGMTARRITRLLRGMDVDPETESLNDYLYLNSRAESKHLTLTDTRALRALINALKAKRTEFLILDVLNVLHEADENDNTEMRQVLKRVEHIRDEVGCQICVVHHSRKNWDDAMTLSEVARGSSAIAGFAEFIIGFRLVDEAEQVRQVKFETKSGAAHRSFYWRIYDYDVVKGVQLQRVDWQPKKQRTKSAKEIINA